VSYSSAIPAGILLDVVVKNHLKMTVAHIEANPELLNQDYWAYREGPEAPVSHCLIGWYLSLHHDVQWVWFPEDISPESQSEYAPAVLFEGEETQPGVLFTRLTGIPRRLWVSLTNSNNRVEVLRRYVEEYAATGTITSED
jgi:hypothetical protein